MIIKQSFLFLASITFLSLFSSSCRSAKYLQDDQYLVTDVDVKGIPTELKETAEMYVANDLRPNSPLYLTIYNLFNTRKGRYKTDNIKNVGESPRLLDSAIVELSAVQIQRFLQTKGYFNAQVEPVVALEKRKQESSFWPRSTNRTEFDKSVERSKILQWTVFINKYGPIKKYCRRERSTNHQIFLPNGRRYTNRCGNRGILIMSANICA